MVAFSPFDDRFDISPTAGFLPNETPLTRLGPTWDLWEIALDSASEGAVALHGKGQEGKIWREAVAKVRFFSILGPYTTSTYTNRCQSFHLLPHATCLPSEELTPSYPS